MASIASRSGKENGGAGDVPSESGFGRSVRNAPGINDGAATPPPAFDDSDSDFEDAPRSRKRARTADSASSSTDAQLHRYSDVLSRSRNDAAVRQERKNNKLVRRILQDADMQSDALGAVVQLLFTRRLRLRGVGAEAKRTRVHRGWTPIAHIVQRLSSHTKGEVTTALGELKRRNIIEYMYDDAVLERMGDEVKGSGPLTEVPDGLMLNAEIAIHMHRRPVVMALYRMVPGYRADVDELNKKEHYIAAISDYLDGELRHRQQAMDEVKEHRRRIAATAIVQLGSCVRFTRPVRHELRR